MTNRAMACAVVILAVVGCKTSLQVQRPDGGGALPRGRAGGIPVQLSAPTFTVTERVATEGRPVSYVLSLAYRPDPRQRYFVNVDPAAFSTSEQNFEIGALGQLSAINAQGASSAAAITRAVGEFTAGAISLAAKAAGTFAFAEEGADAVPNLCNLLKMAAAAQCKPPRQKAPLDQLPEDSSNATCAAKPPGAACADECCRAVRALWAQREEGQSDERTAALAYPLDRAQAGALASAADHAGLYGESWERLVGAECAFQDAAGLPVERAGGTGPCVEKPASPRPDTVDAALTRDAIARVGAAIADRDADALAAIACPGAVCTRPNALDPWNELKKQAQQVIAVRRLGAALRAASRLSPEAWRDRRAQALERRIAARLRGLAEARASRARAETVRALESDLEADRDELAAVTDTTGERRRALALEHLLAQPARPGEKGSLSMGDREGARRELEAVLTLIAQKRQALRPPPEPATRAMDREVRMDPLWMDRDGPSTAEWVGQKAAQVGNPEFIVVIEKGVQP